MKFPVIINNLISILALVGGAVSLWLLYGKGKVFEAQIGAFVLFIAFCLIVWGSLKSDSTSGQTKKTRSNVKEAKSPRDRVLEDSRETDSKE